MPPLRLALSLRQVVAAAHIYNTMRHELPTFPQWQDMEALILSHSVNRIFWRENVPSSTAQYRRSYERTTGVSEMIAQHDEKRAAKVIVARNVEQRGIGPVSLVSAQYHGRFCFAANENIETLGGVEKILNLATEYEMECSLRGLRLLEEANTPLSNRSLIIANHQALDRVSSCSLTRQSQRTHTLPNIQLLHALGTRVSQESYTLNSDYLSFHIRCMLLLKAVYGEFENDIIATHTKLDWGCAELLVVPHWLFLWMEDETRRSDLVERLGQIMGPFIKEEGGAEIAALRQLHSNRGWEVEQVEEKLSRFVEVGYRTVID